jgi:uncharacterized protein (TIGR03086 family)
MDLLDALDTAAVGFRARLASVGAGDWDRPTPCEDWDVHHLVAHVIGGNRFGALILDGASAEDAFTTVVARRQVGDDPVADLDESHAELRARFVLPGALDGTVDHIHGAVPASRFLEMRVYDVALHTWDLARAVEAPDALDPGLAATTLGVVTGWDGEPEPPGPSPEATQRRLLEVTGRRADWSPPVRP